MPVRNKKGLGSLYPENRFNEAEKLNIKFHNQLFKILKK